MKAMILAAGFGTRLRPFTNKRPKPLFPILGRPILLITIEKLRQFGFSPIYVNCHHLSPAFVELFKNDEDVILLREPNILGTGGGLRMAMKHFDSEPVLVTNGDIYHDIDFGNIYRKHMAYGNRVSLVMHDFYNFNKVSVSREGFVKDFEKPLSSSYSNDDLMAFTGIHVLDPQILESIPPNRFYNIIDLYKEQINQGELLKSIIVKDVFWRDIGTPEDYLDLHAHLLQELNVTGIGKFKKIDKSEFMAIGDITIGKNVTMNDWGFVGPGAIIGDNCTLERVVVWDGAVIKDNSVYMDTIVC